MSTSTRPGKESIALICVIINFDCIMIINNALRKIAGHQEFNLGKKGLIPSRCEKSRKQPKI
jgi:hypothetical protein